MRRGASLLSALMICLGWDASAGLYLRPGDRVLRPDEAGQAVTLYLENTDASAVVLGGVEFALELERNEPGAGAEVPAVTSIDFRTGTLLEGHVFREEPDASNSGQRQFWSLILPVLGVNPTLPGRTSWPLATVWFDTTGVGSGRYALRFSGTALGDTMFYDAYGVPLVDFEPETAALEVGAPTVAVTERGVGGLGVLALLWIARWRSSRRSGPLLGRDARSTG